MSRCVSMVGVIAAFGLACCMILVCCLCGVIVGFGVCYVLFGFLVCFVVASSLSISLVFITGLADLDVTLGCEFVAWIVAWLVCWLRLLICWFGCWCLAIQLVEDFFGGYV